MMTYSSITKKQSADTLIVFALVAIFIGIHTGQRYWFFAAIALLMATLVVPYLAKPLAWLWFGLAKILGWVSSKIVLTILFYVMVTPVGIIRQLAGKDSLLLKSFKKNKKTVFKNRYHVFIANDLIYPF